MTVANQWNYYTRWKCKLNCAHWNSYSYNLVSVPPPIRKVKNRFGSKLFIRSSSRIAWRFTQQSSAVIFDDFSSFVAMMRRISAILSRSVVGLSPRSVSSESPIPVWRFHLEDVGKFRNVFQANIYNKKEWICLTNWISGHLKYGCGMLP